MRVIEKTSPAHLYESLEDIGNDPQFDRTISVADILDNIACDMRHWEILADHGKIAPATAYQEMKILYAFAEKYLLHPEISVPHKGAGPSDNDQRRENINYYMEHIKFAHKKAKTSGNQSLINAVNILLVDAEKWKKEYEKGQLSYLATTCELTCLYLYAVEMLENENMVCEPKELQSFLTA